MDETQVEHLAIDDHLELGGYLHTALRKNTDSTITSLAYNLIGMDSMTDAWRQYLAFAWGRLQSAFSENDVASALRAAAGDLDHGRETNALRLAFELFHDDEFRAMGAWVLK